MKFSIANKIFTGFGVFILFVGLVFYITNSTLQESRSINDEINEVYNPSVNVLEKLKHELVQSDLLIKYWVIDQTRDDVEEKTTFRRITSRDIRQSILLIDELSKSWDTDNVELKDNIKINIESLFSHYKVIEELLPDFESYNDPLSVMNAGFVTLENGEMDVLTKSVVTDLDLLIQNHGENTRTVSDQMMASFGTLRSIIVNIGLLLVIAGVFIAVITTKSIVGPVKVVKSLLVQMSKGVMPDVDETKKSNDEIGDMALALDNVVDGLKRTAEFSREVGAGNFSATYTPLGSEDSLGHALLKMRDDLWANERMLEQKVVERTNEVVKQKEEVERQKEKVIGLYKDLTDSIRYAKRLQQTILPTNETVKSIFPESFVLYKPKAIVSGDFYWFKKSGSKLIFSAIDCTGHGVPGAFMSLVGNNALSQVSKVYSKPSSILDNLNRLSVETLNQQDEGRVTVRDGMDLALCTFDPNNYILEFAGAYNPLYIIRNKELIVTKGDKFAIGSFSYGEREYTNHIFQLQEGDAIYVFTDGYADQFGGPKGKKFMKKKFAAYLVEISHLPMEEQKLLLNKKLVEWKGSLSQVDDILVIGVRV